MNTTSWTKKLADFGLFNYIVSVFYGLAFMLPTASLLTDSGCWSDFGNYYFNFLLYGTRCSIVLLPIFAAVWGICSFIQKMSLNEKFYKVGVLNLPGLIFILALLAKPEIRYFYWITLCISILLHVYFSENDFSFSGFKYFVLARFSQLKYLLWCWSILSFLNMFGILDLEKLIQILHGAHFDNHRFFL